MKNEIENASYHGLTPSFTNIANAIKCSLAVLGIHSNTVFVDGNGNHALIFDPKELEPFHIDRIEKEVCSMGFRTDFKRRGQELDLILLYGISPSKKQNPAHDWQLHSELQKQNVYLNQLMVTP